MSTNETYVTLAEAAELLGVSKPTVSRWIRDGYLPAQRIGPRTLRIRRRDLRRVERPSRQQGSEYNEADLRRGGQDPFEELTRIREEILAERGGVPFPSSLPLIHEDRDERVKRL